VNDHHGAAQGAPATGAVDGPVAAIDCGTNSTRLLVVDGAGRPLVRQMRITRLGAGVDGERRLASEAIERTLAVLGDYRAEMDRHRVRAGRLVATSAARDAANAAVFLDRAAEVTGLEPELLSGEEEGRLSFAGATARLPAGWSSGAVVVVDIGGGSTELIVGEPGGEVEAAVSLDIGCVRISERYLVDDPPSAGQLADARREVADQLAAARRQLPVPSPPVRLIGLAGTVSTLAMLEAGLADYDRSQVHHRLLGAEAVERWLARLAAEDSTARLAEAGMVPGREDVIVGGVLVLAEVLRSFGAAGCLVSEDDILDGLAASLRGV
jgi:exopolyphosphatase/guanosine-5'-triphosphate,3'-diphosphate pyrophosphatase